MEEYISNKLNEYRNLLLGTDITKSIYKLKWWRLDKQYCSDFSWYKFVRPGIGTIFVRTKHENGMNIVYDVQYTWTIC